MLITCIIFQISGMSINVQLQGIASDIFCADLITMVTPRRVLVNYSLSGIMARYRSAKRSPQIGMYYEIGHLI